MSSQLRSVQQCTAGSSQEANGLVHVAELQPAEETTKNGNIGCDLNPPDPLPSTAVSDAATTTPCSHQQRGGPTPRRIPLEQQVRECETRWSEEICTAAARSNHPIELLLAGDICAQGYGRPPDATAAQRWWKRAQMAKVDDPAHEWAVTAATQRLQQRHHEK
eukprot:m.236354 g.236354  ORF g.236354 m.236354 type:complete len:163 (+) comp45997_c0_seq1:149-637(+)